MEKNIVFVLQFFIIIQILMVAGTHVGLKVMSTLEDPIQSLPA